MKHSLLSEAPIRGISPLAAIERGVLKTFRYSGRASKSEYWWFATAYAVATVPFVIYDVYAKNQKQVSPQHVAEAAHLETSSDSKHAETSGPEEQQRSFSPADTSTGYEPSPLTWAVAGICAVPLVSLKVRRLHDSNISGKWLPLVDISPVNLYFYSRDSRVKGARFDRKEVLTAKNFYCTFSARPAK
ncbi:MAG: DUF805 domain-containing protein [Rothia sp. (in: high G+C Gram-positive bacteria)]|nr:DUF805 domain-containing protein [Rothia sp. (in: high G+C Gram-positive bacteria)]